MLIALGIRGRSFAGKQKEVPRMLVKKVVTYLVLTVILVTLMITAGCNLVTGSGVNVTLDLDYADFNRIEVGYAFDVEVTRADTYLVRITIDENLQDYLRVSKSGDTLQIGLRQNYHYTGITHRAVINLPDLYRLELSGASDAVVSGFSTSHDMDFDISGASKIDLRDMKAGDTEFNLSGASKVVGNMEMDNVKFDLSGASSLNLAGSAQDVDINASGASHVKLPDFPLANADIGLSGASHADISISGQLDVDLSGASDLKYTGSPRLGSIDITGGSSISQK